MAPRPAAVFAAAEKDALRPLPAGPFVLATWAKAKIGPDICARVGKVLYSLPWRHIVKTADVRVTGTMVQFFIGDLVKTHPRKSWGKQTDFGDYHAVELGIGCPDVTHRLGVTRQAARQHCQQRRRDDTAEPSQDDAA